MVFSSITFIVYFLPAFLAVYFLMPDRGKNAVIFTASLIFYYYGVKEHPEYLLLMLISVIVNYTAARFIERCSTKRSRAAWLAAGLIWNFGSLFTFKYMDFISENINALLSAFNAGVSLPLVKLVLPIGISFYTFQISSYLIDVYNKKIHAERSILTLGTYLCMFPQLIAGPIVTYSSISKQLHSRVHSMRRFEQGLREFTIGLSLKVLIANQNGRLWAQVNAIGAESISCRLAWLGIAAFTFQIYFDFYGYSLMAKGLGCIMGFDFPDNFRNPYLSRSMTEFWRRWHITLGSWFREYVYIPLGGKKSHITRNLFVVWMLTGLKKYLDKFPILGHCYMLFVIPLSWLLFAVKDIKQLWIYICRLFPFLGQTTYTVFDGDFAKYASAYLVSLIAAVVCCTGIPRELDDPFLYYNF